MNIISARESTDGKVVYMDRGDYTTCTVLLHGGTILSWRICNEEQIFMSRQSDFSAYGKVRGGIRVIFPQQLLWTFGRRHGFGRDIMWKVERGPERLEDGDLCLDIAVGDDCYTRSMWNFAFKLMYRIILHPNKLSLCLKVINLCDYTPMDFHFMFQCFLKVDDIDDVVIKGLKGCVVDDLLFHFEESMSIFKNEELRIEGKVDKAFGKTHPEVKMFVSDNKVVILTKDNVPNFKVWNPGEDHYKESSDFDIDEYKYFVSLEGGTVRRKVHLPKHQEWKMGMVLEVKELPEKAIIYKKFYDWFDGYC